MGLVQVATPMACPERRGGDLKCTCAARARHGTGTTAATWCTRLPCKCRSQLSRACLKVVKMEIQWSRSTPRQLALVLAPALPVAPPPQPCQCGMLALALNSSMRSAILSTMLSLLGVALAFHDCIQPKGRRLPPGVRAMAAAGTGAGAAVMCTRPRSHIERSHTFAHMSTGVEF